MGFLFQQVRENLAQVLDLPFIHADVNGHALIVLLGGVFLMYTALKEIFHMLVVHDLEGENGKGRATRTAGSGHRSGAVELLEHDRGEPGVIARLDACEADWCRIVAGGQRGWVEKTALWGVDPDELRD